MLERYSFPEMKKIWQPELRFDRMLKVELAILEGWVNCGRVPREYLSRIKAKAKFDLKRIAELEAITRHDVAAFLENVGEQLSPEEQKYLHYGVTSYDVVDTALSLLLRDSADLILKDLNELLKLLKKLALGHEKTIMAGRTHGRLAEPTSLGLKFLLWYSEFLRHKERLSLAKAEIAVGKISGTVGTYATVLPEVEAFALKKLKLKPADISSQILQRDRHAFLITVLALLATSLEKIALQIRLLQINEREELQESFQSGQIGSSAMPHKKNPILCERICGLSRILRGNVIPALENIPLWDERDISHSSPERIIFPQSLILTDYLLRITIKVLTELKINPEKMRENLEKAYGSFFSQPLLLKMLEKGIPKEKAYRIVQELSFKAAENKIQLKELVIKDKTLASLFSSQELSQIFNVNRFLQNSRVIYNRFGFKEEK